ncbi:spermidine putrescine ABC transporter permease component PotB [Lachnospiraceae bacterium KM106-2]|nr:spermidine putrescine ABC transporter permease component PotB [Lachnospiraceae bacterium KM106-2]
MNNNRKRFLAFPYILWMSAFIVIPLFIIVYYGFTNADGAFTFANLEEIIDPVNLKALGLSLLLSLISTIVCLLLAYPLAMIIRNSKHRSSNFIIFIFILPMWMNSLLRTIAWQTLLEKNGVINTILQTIHLPKMNVMNTPTAVVIGMVYNFLPFMVLPIYNTLMKIDNNVINAARDLGANGVQTFCRIIFPLSMPGVVSGITMVYVPSLTTFVISDLLGGGKSLLIGNVIEQEFKFNYDWNVGSGLSLVLMVFIIISMAFIVKYDGDMEDTNVW